MTGQKTDFNLRVYFGAAYHVETYFLRLREKFSPDRTALATSNN
jgi:hypothetical protein